MLNLFQHLNRCYRVAGFTPATFFIQSKQIELVYNDWYQRKKHVKKLYTFLLAVD